MPFDPDERPREMLVLLVAAGCVVFRGQPVREAFETAENFAAEAEKRVGALNP